MVAVPLILLYVRYIKSMKLTDTEISYFSHKAQTRNQNIADKFYAESDRIGAPDRGISPRQIYLSRIRDFAKQTIESRVETYIEVCRKFNKYPDEDDVHWFTDHAKPYVTSKLNLFLEHRSNPFGENIHELVTDAQEKTLVHDLQKIFTDGLSPLLSFHLEGKVEEERRGQDVEKPIKEADDKAVGSSIYNIAGDFVGGDQTKVDDNLGVTQTLRGISQSPSENLNLSSTSPESKWINRILLIVGLVALFVTVAGIVAAILYPEVRRYLGLP